MLTVQWEMSDGDWIARVSPMIPLAYTDLRVDTIPVLQEDAAKSAQHPFGLLIRRTGYHTILSATGFCLSLVDFSNSRIEHRRYCCRLSTYKFRKSHVKT